MNNNNPKLTPNAQRLRREMTEEERRLWFFFLKSLPVTVNRQKVIGPYIVDFYCASAKLVIEVDGSQHYEEAGVKADKQRDTDLERRGFRVLRYSNYDINCRFKEVCDDILSHMDMPTT